MFMGVNIKMTLFPKSIYRFNASLINIPADFSVETDRLILTLNTQILKKRTKPKDSHFPISKFYTK